MLKITKFTCEHLQSGILTDKKQPAFRYMVESDREAVTISSVKLSCNGWEMTGKDELVFVYSGEALKPFSCYEAKIEVEDNYGDKAEATLTFETGRLDEAWAGRFITDTSYSFTEKRVSPTPIVFRKAISLEKPVKKAYLYATALGIYDVFVGDTHISDRYFAPGFTSYKHQMQYQRYDITEALGSGNDLFITVAGGWAVGSYVFTRVNRVTCPRQALLAEVRIEFEDGTSTVVPTDDSWMVSRKGPVSMADIYDGETYDARISLKDIEYTKAGYETVKFTPAIKADYSSPVIEHEVMKATFLHNDSNGNPIYDFGQNFAGVVKLRIKNAKGGEYINVKHAEILTPEGDLNTLFLRSAKCEINYTCKAGNQDYHVTFSYMGFRYISVQSKDLDIANIEIEAVAIYSDIESIGTFECSNELINKLQSNITWSSKSNFVDIPTDCPQRDERMGWTGDIAVFAPTATFNFEISRFIDKWLEDLRSEQNPGGGIPNTIPVQGYGFPATMPRMAIDWWGDACILVPWSIYKATGNTKVLADNYETMKKYIKACKFWAGLFSVGKSRYIWSGISMFHFGDWIAPDVPQMGQWQARHKWTATASLNNTSSTVAKIAEILGKEDDAKYYKDLSVKVADAYISKLTDGNGKLLNEFQTAYVLPIHLRMFNDATLPIAAKNLSDLVAKNNYCIGTGFPGTPFILFALADNGQVDTAYKMLENTICPSWLYTVKAGGTTIWERWDGLDENGQCAIANDGTGNVPMISYNHYASGAVGDFLYKRVAGIEMIEPGYKKFQVKPVLGGTITHASASTVTPYGKASVSWKLDDGKFSIEVDVPVNTTCDVILPSGKTNTVSSGHHTFAE